MIEAGEASLAWVVLLLSVTLRRKRRQAAALQNGLGVDASSEREGSNRGQRRAKGAQLNCEGDSEL